MRSAAFSFPIARFKTRFQRFGFAFAITALCLILTLVLSKATNRGVFQVVVVGRPLPRPLFSRTRRSRDRLCRPRAAIFVGCQQVGGAPAADRIRVCIRHYQQPE